MAEEGCAFCEFIKSKKNLLYEDKNLVAVVPEKPIAKGHIMVIPKEHHTELQQIEDKDFQHLFYAASFSATALFENLGAQGTNILLNTGGQLKKGEHIHINVLARWSEDKLNFLWTPKQLSEDELKSVQSKIKDKCDMIGVEKKGKEIVDLDRKPEKLESSEEKAPEHKEKEEEKAEERTEETPAGKEEKEENKDKEKDKEEKEEKKDKEEKDRESYLIKQLRRMP